MKNPCRDCPHLPEDKNGPICQACTRRVAYVRSIGSLVDMQPLVNGSGTGGINPSVGAGYDAGADDMRTKLCRGPLCREIDPSGVEKPVSDFSSKIGSRDGFNNYCRVCDAHCARKRKQRVAEDLLPARSAQAGRDARKENNMENQAKFKLAKPGYKICRGAACLSIDPEGVVRPLSSFGPSKVVKDGHNGACRMCVAFDHVCRWAKKKDKPAPDPEKYVKKYKCKEPGASKSVAESSPESILEAINKEHLKNHSIETIDTGSSLSEAYKIINGDRQDSYGNPEDSFALIAKYWQTYLSHRLQHESGAVRLSALDVAHMMVLFKTARMSGQAPCRDNYIDAQGYLAIAADRLILPPSDDAGDRQDV